MKSKRGLILLAVVVLLGTWFFVVGYEFLEKENELFQKRVKIAKEEQQRCMARNAKYRNFDQFRTSIRLPYTSDLSLDRWMQQFNTVHAGMSESEVAIVMGAPDYARCDVSEKGDKFVGSTWVYEIAVPADLTNASQNSALQVLFGPDGKMADKSAVNMQPQPSPTPALAAATPTPVPVATPQGSPSPAASPSLAAPSPTAMPSAPAPSGTPATATSSPTPQ